MTGKIDVASLAKLARLDVSGEELSKLEKEIPNILRFVESIRNVETPPETNIEGLRNVMRADENPHESGAYAEKLLKAAPSREGSRIAVKQVLKKQGA